MKFPEIAHVKAYYSARPFIKINVTKDEPSIWLFDTGAAVSCISKAYFTEIRKSTKVTKLPDDGINLMGAGKSTIETLGRYAIPISVSIKGKTRTCVDAPVIVCNTLTNPGIFGIDLINEFGIVYYGKAQEFKFEEEVVEVLAMANSQQAVYSTKKVFMEARTSKTIELSCPPTGSTTEQIGLYTFKNSSYQSYVSVQTQG